MFFVRNVISVSIISLFAAPAFATVVTANSANIASIFGSASDGDVINLVGQFGMTRLVNRSFATGLTLDASAAKFSDTLLFKNVSGVRTLGGNFGSATALTTYNKGIVIYGGSNITFINPSVVGYYGGYGIAFSGTTNATVKGGTFTKLRAGVLFDTVTNGSIVQNNSVASVNDGFDVTDSTNILVEGNRCSGTTPLVGNHPDCVQMWNSDAAHPLDNIMVRNNTALGATQGFNNFGSKGVSTRISFIGNRVDGLFPQGVSCGTCSNSVISGNVLTTMNGAPWRVSMNLPNGTNNIVTNNSVGALNRAAARSIAYYTKEQLVGGDTPTVVAASAVPEPSMWATMMTGIAFIGMTQRRQRGQIAA